MDKNYIDNKRRLGSVMGTDRIKTVLKSLGEPQKCYPCVHIAGTNGKGSVSAFLTSALAANGIRVGTYNSPAVFSSYEGIRVDNREIPENEYLKIADLIKAQEEKTGVELTFFEFETVIAFLYFKEKNISLAVVECGMGGRGDATDAELNTLVAVLTSIGLEHTAELGDTTEKIAKNKAAIIPAGGFAVSAPQDESALAAIKAECERKGAALTIAIPDSKGGAHYQRINRAVAFETLRVLKKFFKLSEKISEEAVKNTVWAGRYQKIAENFLLDGAHNPDGMRDLALSLDDDFKGVPRIFLFGAFKDKNTAEMCKYLMGAKRVYVLKWDNPRASDPEKLLSEVRKLNIDAVVADIKTAVSLAIHEKGDKIIVAAGSLSHLSLIKKAYEECTNG